MTIDSAYFPERFDADEDVNYTFTFEHTGETSLQVYVIQPDGRTFRVQYDPELVVE